MTMAAITGRILRLDDLTEQLGYTKRGLYEMARSGRIPAFKLGKQWVIRPEALERWLEEREAQHQNMLPRPSPQAKRKDIEVEKAFSGLEEACSELANTSSLVRNAIDVIGGPIRELLVGALKNGVRGIYFPRRLADEPNANTAIKEILEQAEGEVLLQGVSLRQYFHDKMFWRLVWEKLTNDGVSIKALILDPLSKAARARVAVEEALTEREAKELSDPKKFRETQIFRDIQGSVSSISNLQNQIKQRDCIDAKFYDCTPFAHLIISKDGMIIEQYHFGREELSVMGECIGELVPPTHVEAGTPYYRLICNSFHHLWRADNPFIRVKSLNQVQEEMADFLDNGRWPAGSLEPTARKLR